MNSKNEMGPIITVLDEDGYPSVERIAENGWRTRISPDFPLPQQLEWLCGVCNDGNAQALTAFLFDGPSVVGPVDLSPDPDGLMQFLVKYAYASVLICVGPELYFFKDLSDRYCVYFGNETLVADAYKLSPADSNRAFLDWIDDAKFIESERASLLEVFERYKAA